MFIPQILTLFLLSTAAGAAAASSDLHSPINTNEDEDVVVVSPPNLHSLATTKQRRAKGRKKQSKNSFDDDDDGFDLPLSLEVELPNNADVLKFKESLAKLFSLVLKGYDEDGTKVIGFAPLTNEDEDGDGRELAASQTVTTIKFVLKLRNKICFRPGLNEIQQNACYCNTGEDILALLILAVDEVNALIGSLIESFESLSGLAKVSLVILFSGIFC